MGKHKSKKHKKEKKSRRKRHSSESSNTSEEEWLEKTSNEQPLKRDEWLTLPTQFTSTSTSDRRKERDETRRLEREQSQYNPRNSARELNPFWKDGGDGLPKHRQFRKPQDDNTLDISKSRRKETVVAESSQSQKIEIDDDKQLNVLAAKIVKAELMGNSDLVSELKGKLEELKSRIQHNTAANNEVLLTATDSKGYSRPVKLQSEYGGSSRKKQKVETHKDGSRVRYFANDDKYSLQQLFEEEKYNSSADQNRDFMKIAARQRKNDDLDDVFADDIRKNKPDDKNRSKAIRQHQAITESLDNCRRCLQSEQMSKHLMIAMGETMYLSLPYFEPLTDGHCFIVPVRHVPCMTQLDENEWTELLDFHKAINKMFASQDRCVIFFETALYLHRFPHTIVECIPMPKEQGSMAPIYFKKAIDESETEWALNKKLIQTRGPDIRKAVPKGLPYFSVSFGLDKGFAHVVEDERYFPRNFAQEIIGGMLDLHHGKWRKPRTESRDVQNERVQKFNVSWTSFDCTGQL